MSCKDLLWPLHDRPADPLAGPLFSPSILRFCPIQFLLGLFCQSEALAPNESSPRRRRVLTLDCSSASASKLVQTWAIFFVYFAISRFLWIDCFFLFDESVLKAGWISNEFLLNMDKLCVRSIFIFFTIFVLTTNFFISFSYALFVTSRTLNKSEKKYYFFFYLKLLSSYVS